MKLARLYYLANAVFVLIVAAGALISPSSAHPLYLIVLFALCSSPLLDMRHLNDRFVLLVLFSVVFFQFYGTSDLLHLLYALPDMVTPGIMSASERQKTGRKRAWSGWVGCCGRCLRRSRGISR
jgi:hypothetical protein